VRRLSFVLVLVAVLVGAFLFIHKANPPWYERIRYPLHYSEYIQVHAREHGLDPALVAAVIYQESKFDTSAKSSSGAIGLMQVTPDTAHGIAVRTGGDAFRTSDLYNADINIRYGAWYLANLFTKYHNEPLVLAAYNAGIGAVIASKGIPLFPQTQAYVSEVESLIPTYTASLAASGATPFGQAVVAAATAQLGVPYSWGGGDAAGHDRVHHERGNRDVDRDVRERDWRDRSTEVGVGHRIDHPVRRDGAIDDADRPAE